MSTLRLAVLSAALVLGGISLTAQTPDLNTRVPAGSRVFIEPMDGFETYLSAALTKKKVPLVVVASADRADFTIRGNGSAQKPGWARTVFLGQTHSDAQASISVVNVKTDVVAFAYAYDMKNSYRGQQSAAESCAKHLKEWVEDSGPLPR